MRMTTGSLKTKAISTISSLEFELQEQEQQKHQQQQQAQQGPWQQEEYEGSYTPLYSSRWQDKAAAAELRRLQLERADEELQAWATASRGWSRNIAGYGPSWGATRQPGGTVVSAGMSYSLY